MGLIGKLFKKNNEEDRIRVWNQFIEETCSRDLDVLSKEQRMAVLCFWYDAEMNSGGHSGYFDCYPDTDPEELAEAIRLIANDEIAANFLRAVSDGKTDDYQATDDAFYDFSPALVEYVEAYVDAHESEMLNA